MSRASKLLTFTLDDQRYALLVSAVERVARSVEITRLPKAPDIVLGVLNYHGVVIPTVNIRRRFGLSEREMELNDHLIIAKSRRRMVALPVDEVSGVLDYTGGGMVSADRILPRIDYVQGVLKLDDGLVLIHDLDSFLSLDEHRALDEALR